MIIFGLLICTHLQKRNRKAEGKRNGMRLKHPVTSQGYVVEALESSKVSVGKIVSPVNFDGNTGSSLCCMSMMGQSESSSSDVAADAIKFQSLSVEGDNPASSTEITSDASKEQDRDGILGVVCNDGQDCDSLHGSAVVNDTMKISASTTDLNDGIFSGSCSTDAAISQEPGERLMEHDHLECSLMTLHEAEGAKICEDYVPEKPCVSESVSYSTCSEVLDHDGTDSQDNGDVGDWMVYWDSYYMRNYFYNIRTRTSTWHPPQGMEHISTVDTTYKSNEMTAQVIDMNVTTDLETTDLCGLSKTESFEEAISDDVSQGQPYCELSGGLELTVDNSMSNATLPTVSLSRCLEHSVELNESNNTGNDGNASYLLSNVQDLARYIIFLYLLLLPLKFIFLLIMLLNDDPETFHWMVLTVSETIPSSWLLMRSTKMIWNQFLQKKLVNQILLISIMNLVKLTLVRKLLKILKVMTPFKY